MCVCVYIYNHFIHIYIKLTQGHIYISLHICIYKINTGPGTKEQHNNVSFPFMGFVFALEALSLTLQSCHSLAPLPSNFPSHCSPMWTCTAAKLFSPPSLKEAFRTSASALAPAICFLDSPALLHGPAKEPLHSRNPFPVLVHKLAPKCRGWGEMEERGRPVLIGRWQV